MSVGEVLSTRPVIEELRKLFDNVADIVNIGVVQHLPRFQVVRAGKIAWDVTVEEMTKAWRGTLDW